MDLVVEKVSFQCKNCGKSLLKDRRIIHVHNARCGKTEPMTKGVMKAPKPPQELDNSSEIKLGEGETTLDETSGQKDGESSDLLQNICKFQCQPCAMVFDSWRLTLEHLSKKHKVGKQNRKREKYDVEKYIIESHFHKCFLCGKQVLQDYDKLRVHVECAHNMNVPEYKAALAKSTKDKSIISQSPPTDFHSFKPSKEDMMRTSRAKASERLPSNKQSKHRQSPKSVSRSSYEMVTVQVDPDLFPKGKEDIIETQDTATNDKSLVQEQNQRRCQDVEIITLGGVAETQEVADSLTPVINNRGIKVTKTRSKFNTDNETNEKGEKTADDTDAQFLSILSNHIQRSNISERAKQNLRGEILASIIDSDAQFVEMVAKVQASKTSTGAKLKLQGDILATISRHIT